MIYGPLSEALLDGRYRVGEVIGSGGFGTVYAAMHLGLAAKVAIKVPRVDEPSMSETSRAIARFLEEGRTLKRLRHPNLAAALDVALLPPDEQGRRLPYLVLEWCDGPTLKAWRAARPGPMPPHDAWKLLRPAFEAIAHAHAEGVAHRDIKPSNILIETTRDGVESPRVIDFGIAKVLGAAERSTSGATRTTTENSAFTPKYAAPEQMTGIRSGPWTDVYTLALVLLETIRGEPVFADDDQARFAVMESDLPTPAKLGLDLGSWNAPLERALAPKPSDRFKDAGDLLRALDGDPPPQRPSDVHGEERTSRLPRVSQGTVAAPPSDDSFVPSSRTLLTGPSAANARTDAVTSPRTAIALGSVAAALLLGFTVVLALVIASGRYTPAKSTAKHVVASAQPRANDPRPLRSLTGPELVSRAEAGGLVACHVLTETAKSTEIECAEGRLAWVDYGTRESPDKARVWTTVEQQARGFATGGRDARFTIDGGVALALAAPPGVIDAVVARVLDGVRHEGVTAAHGFAERH